MGIKRRGGGSVNMGAMGLMGIQGPAGPAGANGINGANGQNARKINVSYISASGAVLFVQPNAQSRIVYSTATKTEQDDNIEEIVNTALKIKAGKKYGLFFERLVPGLTTSFMGVRKIAENNIIVPSEILVDFNLGHLSPIINSRFEVLDLSDESGDTIDIEFFVRNSQTIGRAIDTKCSITIFTIDEGAGANAGEQQGAALTQQQTDFLNFLMTRLVNQNGQLSIRDVFNLMTSGDNGLTLSREYLDTLQKLIQMAYLQVNPANEFSIQGIKEIDYLNNSPIVKYLEGANPYTLNLHYLRQQVKEFKYMQPNLIKDTNQVANQAHELYQAGSRILPLFDTNSTIGQGLDHGISAADGGTTCQLDTAGLYRIIGRFHFKAVKSTAAAINMPDTPLTFFVRLKRNRRINNALGTIQDYQQGFESGYMSGQLGGGQSTHKIADGSFDAIIEIPETETGSRIYFESFQYGAGKIPNVYAYLSDEIFSTVLVEKLHD